MANDATTDLFRNDLSGEKAEVRTPVAPARQFVRNPCECGAAGGWRMVMHYDVVECRCGRKFWILQPKREGPFVASLWPGLPGMERRAA